MWIDIAILLGCMIVFMMTGMPTFLGMALAVIAYFFAFPTKLPDFIIAQSFVQGIDSYSFAAIPFFFLAGEVMNSGGMSARLLRLAQSLLGHVRGGLSHVNIAANMVMAGVSGSAAADAAAVGSVLVPAMKKQGYPGAYAAAVTAAAATIGPMIPPSIPLVIFGLIAGVSIGKLFLAGVVPGVLMGVFLFVTAYVIARRRGYPKDAWSGWSEVWSATSNAFAALLMPVLVVAGLVGGIATTTEIGAFAVAYAVIVSVFIYREMSLSQLWKTVCKAATDACMVLIIASIAGAFTWIIANLGLGKVLATWISSITTNPAGVMIVICIILLIAGTVLEPVTTLLVLIPLFIPLCLQVGIDLVQFGIVTVLATLIGMITPPVGFLIYLTSAQAKSDVMAVVVELLPFVAALVALLFALALIPSLSLLLPRLVMG
jgi:tripartite ATP-independent transporter DctM subunit